MGRCIAMIITGVWKNNSLVGQEPTQVGSALEALGIQSISALSPRPKEGWKNSLHPAGSSGSRTPLKGIETIEEANHFLQSTFLKAFNRRLPSDQRISKSLERNLEKSGPGSNHRFSLYGYGWQR